MKVILHIGAHRCATRSFQNYMTRLDREIYFIIEVEGQGVGTVSIADMVDGKGEVVRFLVAPEHQGRGYGSEALRLAVGYAAEQGVDSLYANIYEDNAASRRSFEKAGFEHLRTEAGICYYELA